MNYLRSIFQAMFGLVLVLAAGAIFAFIKFSPHVKGLEEKVPEKYAQMIVEAKAFHVENAIHLYQELDRMSYENVLHARYQIFKTKWESNDEFRQAQWESQVELRLAMREEKEKERQDGLNDLRALREDKKSEARFADWLKADSWQKSIILRGNCIRYFELEKRNSRRRGKGLDLSRTVVMLAKPANNSMEIAELCEGFVPMTHEENVVKTSLDTLKEKMNYFYFVEMLDSIGIPRQEVVSFSSRLAQMTRDLPES